MLVSAALNALFASAVCFGVGFPVRVAMGAVASSAIGHWAGAVIDQADELTRSAVERRTGMKGHKSEVGELVRKVNAAVGAFLPGIPIATAAYAAYLAWRVCHCRKYENAMAETDGDADCQPPRNLHPAFTAPGRMVLR